MSTARQRSPPCTAAAASREQRDGAPRTRAAAPTAAATSDLLRDDARHHLPDVGSGSVAGGGLEGGFVENLGVGHGTKEIGRGACRGRGEISGVAGSLKKKKKIERVEIENDKKRRNVQAQQTRMY